MTLFIQPFDEITSNDVYFIIEGVMKFINFNNVQILCPEDEFLYLDPINNRYGSLQNDGCIMRCRNGRTDEYHLMEHLCPRCQELIQFRLKECNAEFLGRKIW